jgi:chromosome segregation ATPase
MASSQTKAISFRIPVETYADLLQEATNKRFNLTELLYSKLFSNADSKRLEDVLSETERKLNEAELRITELEQLNGQLHELHQDAMLTTERNAQQNKIDKASHRELVDDYSARVEELEKHNAELNAICRALKEEAIEISEQNEMYRIQIQQGQSNENASKNLHKKYEDKISKLELDKKEDKKLLTKQESEITRLNKKINELQIAIEGFKNQYKSLETKLRLSDQNVIALNKEVETCTEKIHTMINFHNHQINELHIKIERWVSYSVSDAELFNEILWK